MIHIIQSKREYVGRGAFSSRTRFHLERTDAIESPNVTLNQLKKIVSFLDAFSTWLPAGPTNGNNIQSRKNAKPAKMLNAVPNKRR